MQPTKRKHFVRNKESETTTQVGGKRRALMPVRRTTANRFRFIFFHSFSLFAFGRIRLPISLSHLLDAIILIIPLLGLERGRTNKEAEFKLKGMNNFELKFSIDGGHQSSLLLLILDYSLRREFFASPFLPFVHLATSLLCLSSALFHLHFFH